MRVRRVVRVLRRAVVLLVTALGACGPVSGARTTRLYAAASLTDVAHELARHFETASGLRAVVCTAASSTLAQQIREGAPPGVFVSAGPEWVDRLEEWDCVEPGTRADLLGNELVVVVPRGAARRPAALGDLVDACYARIALADPDAVPAGRYARTALERAEAWDAVRPRVVSTSDVRVALSYVASGEADAGIVYTTDAAASAGVDVALRVPGDLCPPIVYPLVVTRGGGDAARALRTFLLSETARAVFARAGFAPASGARSEAR